VDSSDGQTSKKINPCLLIPITSPSHFPKKLIPVNMNGRAWGANRVKDKGATNGQVRSNSIKIAKEVKCCEGNDKRSRNERKRRRGERVKVNSVKVKVKLEKIKVNVKSSISVLFLAICKRYQRGDMSYVAFGIRRTLCFRNSSRFMSENSLYNRFLIIGTVFFFKQNNYTSSLSWRIQEEPTFKSH
jgi:hypothetical protein